VVGRLVDVLGGFDTTGLAPLLVLKVSFGEELAQAAAKDRHRMKAEIRSGDDVRFMVYIPFKVSDAR
jgi:hypothetical protein